MKIIKEFNDDAWAKEISPGMTDPSNLPCWSWGLGDDGDLYFRGVISGISYRNNWRSIRPSIHIPLTFKKMIQIVDHFKPLLPFI